MFRLDESVKCFNDNTTQTTDQCGSGFARRAPVQSIAELKEIEGKTDDFRDRLGVSASNVSRVILPRVVDKHKVGGGRGLVVMGSGGQATERQVEPKKPASSASRVECRRPHPRPIPPKQASSVRSRQGLRSFTIRPRLAAPTDTVPYVPYYYSRNTSTRSTEQQQRFWSGTTGEANTRCVLWTRSNLSAICAFITSNIEHAVHSRL